MIIFIIIFIDLIVVFISAFAIRKTVGSFSVRKIEPMMLIFLIQFVAYSLIGSSLFLAGYGRNFYQYEFVSNINTRFLVWGLVLYATLLFFLLIALFEKMSRKKQIKSVIEKLTYRASTNTEKNIKYMVFILLLLVLFYYIYYAVSINYIPIIEFFTASSEKLAELRFIDKFNFSGNSIIKNVFLLILPPILSYTCLFLLKDKFSKSNLLLFIFSLVIVFITLTARFEKSYLIYYFLGMSLIPIKQKKQNQLKINVKKKQFPWIIPISIFIGLFYVAFIGRISINSLKDLEGSLYRVIYSQIIGAYLHFDLFPSQIPYLNFTHFPGVIAALNNVQEIRSARLVMLATSNNQFAGNANTLFIGEAFANGGMLAVLISPLIVALSVYLIFYIFNNLHFSSIVKAGFIYVIIDLPFTGGFLDFIYKPSIIIVLSFVIFVDFIARKIKIN